MDRSRSLYDAVRSCVQGGSNMIGTNCDLFTRKSSRSYLNHLVHCGEIQGRTVEPLCTSCLFIDDTLDVTGEGNTHAR
jgi:hypothetical protein